MNVFRTPTEPADHGMPQLTPVVSSRHVVGRHHRRRAILIGLGIIAVVGIGLAGFLTGRDGGGSAPAAVEPSAGGATSPTTAEPTTTAQAANPSLSDGVLSETEYLRYVQFMHAREFAVLSPRDAQDLGSAACAVAKLSDTKEEFLASLPRSLPATLDAHTAVYMAGIVTWAMCLDDILRLGFAE